VQRQTISFLSFKISQILCFNSILNRIVLLLFYIIFVEIIQQQVYHNAKSRIRCSIINYMQFSFEIQVSTIHVSKNISAPLSLRNEISRISHIRQIQNREKLIYRLADL